MIRTMLGFFAILFTLFISVYGGDNGTLTFVLENVKNTNGFIGIAIYTNSAGFPNDHMNAYKKVLVKPSKGTNVVKINNLPYGEYSAAIMHDENMNDKLDMGIFGPLEGYGFSKNIPGSLFGPGFDECKVKFNKPDLILKIIMRY